MESVAGLSRRAAATAASIGPILEFYSRSRYADRRGDPAICDLTFGNPHEFPLPGLVEAIRERAIPARQGLVRLQDLGGGAAGLPGRGRRPRARPRLRAGRHRPDGGCVRRHRGGDPAGAGPRRRGDLLAAALVLLRADAARRRRRAAPGRPDAGPVRSRPGGDRGGDRPAHAAGHRQHAAQPDRPDLWARRAGGAGRAARACLGAHRAADLPPVRRALPAHPLRWPRVHEPCCRLSLDPDRLQLRQGPARPGAAARLSRRLAPHAAGRSARRCATASPPCRSPRAGASPTR